MMIESSHKLDHVRKTFNGTTSRIIRSEIGQFLTPSSIAKFMSAMFDDGPKRIRILDPGAGTGVLFAMCVETIISQEKRPLSIDIVAYENDTSILHHLKETMDRCMSLCASFGILFQGKIINEDFVSAAVTEINEPLLAVPIERFTHVILNPPYMKINSQTVMSRRLYSYGIEAANLYAAFVWLSMQLLEFGGQMVAITPRSFCNGPYFRKFRIAFLQMMSLKRIHLF